MLNSLSRLILWELIPISRLIEPFSSLRRIKLHFYVAKWRLMLRWHGNKELCIDFDPQLKTRLYSSAIPQQNLILDLELEILVDDRSMMRNAR
jgi:hypothetical protein